MIDNIIIDKIQIAENLKPVIVAEMSDNHNQSLGKAKRLLKQLQKLAIMPS